MTPEALKDAIDRTLITTDDDVFSLVTELCQHCCMWPCGGLDDPDKQ